MRAFVGFRVFFEGFKVHIFVPSRGLCFRNLGSLYPINLKPQTSKA